MFEMKVLIIGAGAIGIAAGCLLKSAGVGVGMLASEKTAQAIREGGIHKRGLFGDIDIAAGDVDVFTDYDQLRGGYDYVIVSAKAFSNAQIAEELEKCGVLGRGRIVIMQNGIGTEEEYARRFSESAVYNARVITGFERTAPNVSKITVHNAPVLIGSVFGCETEAVKPLCDALSRAGLEAETDEEIGKALWAKLLYNTTLNPLGAILGYSYGELYESAHARAIMEQLVAESFAVMNSGGFATYQKTAEEYIALLYNKLIPDTYAHCSSTLQDIRKRQKTEIDTLNGSIVRLGEKFGVDTPAHRMICRLIGALEDGFFNKKEQ